MATFKLSPFSASEKTLEHSGPITIHNLICEGLKQYEIEPCPEILDFFMVVVDGQEIAKEDWSWVSVTDTQAVLISIVPRGENAGLFRTIGSIGLMVGLTGLLGPLGLTAGSWQSALFIATGTVLGGMALNAIIPVPEVKDKKEVKDSQMYYISGQRNSANLYGPVMRVYGTHKVFPYVGANPYTELVAARSGEIVQYLYGIYDFGLGRVQVNELRIGDTLVTNFSDVIWKLFDPNWDYYLPTYPNALDQIAYQTPRIYKGDVFQDDVGVTLLKAGDSVVRTTQDSEDNALKISVTFSLPEGLVSYNTKNDVGTATVRAEVYISRAGENNWKAYNDPTMCKAGTWSVLGIPVEASSESGDFDANAISATGYVYNNYQTWQISGFSQYLKITDINGHFYAGTSRYQKVYNGLKKGTTVVKLARTTIPLGSHITLFGSYIGQVLSKASVSGGVNYTLTAATTSDIIFQEATRWTDPLQYQGGLSVPNLQPPTTLSYNKKFYGNLGTPRTNVSQLTVNAEAVPELTFSAKKATAVYGVLSFQPINPGQYDIRIERGSSTQQYTSTVRNSLAVLNITSRIDRLPIRTKNTHTFLEISIKATNQLSGSLDNLSAVVTSMLRVWNGTTCTLEETNNPAWVVVDLLTNSTINKNAVPDTRLDLASFLTWANYCDELVTKPGGGTYNSKRFETNFILDYNSTLREVINTVTGAAGASLTITDGKYGVLIDRDKTIPVQVFTPRNSWGFSSTRAYKKKIQCLKISYIDPNSNWQQSQIAVYADGYDVNNAEIIEELTAFACTNPEQAYRYGRFMLAQYLLRQETITINVDFEHLVCTRGDYVLFAHDVMRVGGKACRVISKTGNQITTDEKIIYNALISYGYTARNSSGIFTSTLTVVDENTFTLNGTLPNVGDLIVIGEVGNVTYDLLVKTIEPNGDSAVLTLVEKASAVYTAESSGAALTYDPLLSLNTDSEVTAPPAITGLQVTANSFDVLGTTYQYYIDLQWNDLSAAIYEAYEVYADYGRGFLLDDVVSENSFRYIVNPDYLGIEHGFKVIAVSASGKRIPLTEAMTVVATPLPKTYAPGNITSVALNITTETLQISWPAVNEPDIKEYLIRYSPKTSGTWENSVPLLRVDKQTTLASTQARTGTYLIKAVDLNNNESVIAARAVTTIPELYNLNIVESMDDFPLLEGNKDRVAKFGDTLVLKKTVFGGVETAEYYSEGYYYYATLLDLGQIFTTRIQTLIDAEGFTEADIMSNWLTLDSVVSLASSGFSDWDIEAEVRTSNFISIMSNWSLLSEVTTLTEGTPEIWTEWKKITSTGDYTGRIYQFRLRLISNKINITPRIFGGILKVDMPDRVESYRNIPASPSATINYIPGFYGPTNGPAIALTIDNQAQGDYYIFDSRTVNGFSITFYDKNGNTVNRNFDAQVKGYGRRATNSL